jgi:hypothetical protein
MSQAGSLENLITERSYLLNSLQQENAKATDLLRRISTLEADLAPDGEPKEQRKIRKQLGWLKHRLGETNRQEKAIMARLGQLTYEIQSIERWSQVEQERLNQQHFLDTPLPPFQGLQPMGMNAVAQVFQQQEFPFPPQWSYVQWPQQPGQAHEQPSFQWDAQEHPPEVPAESFVDDEDQVSPSDTKDRSKDAVVSKPTKKPSKPPLTHRPSSMNSADLDVLSTGTPPHPKPVIKRQSIPTIPGHSTIWAPTKEEREAEG